MFPRRYYARRYFAPRYFSGGGGGASATTKAEDLTRFIRRRRGRF